MDFYNEPLASVGDIVIRWRELTVVEATRALNLLEDATAMIYQEFRASRKDIKAVDPALLRMVCVNMVCRVLDGGTDTGLYSAKTQTAGVYSQTLTYSQAGNSLYISRKEKKLLGLSGLRITSISLGGGDVCNNNY